jgi:hypothetical protein
MIKAAKQKELDEEKQRAEYERASPRGQSAPYDTYSYR